MMLKTAKVTRSAGFATTLFVLFAVGACQNPNAGMRHGDASRRAPRNAKDPRIRKVICVFDQKPWLNLDAAGDRDPEGIRFRVFLDGGAGKGVYADGTFHVEMYKINRISKGDLKRTLISDWHYGTDAVHTIAKPGWLGDGYFLHLRWRDKAVAGCEIEMITRFEGADGHVARSATKRLRVPKYDT